MPKRRWILTAALVDAVVGFSPRVPLSFGASQRQFAFSPCVPLFFQRQLRAVSRGVCPVLAESCDGLRRATVWRMSEGAGAPRAGGGSVGAATNVKCIFSDVDGTLLDKKHVLQPETEKAILDAIAAGIPFVMATGKYPMFLS